MSDDYQKIALITGPAWRWRRSTEQKLQMTEEMLHSRESISSIARRHGIAPNLLYRRRRLMAEGGAAVQADDGVSGSGDVRRFEERIRELEWQRCRKTLDVEILKQAMAKSRARKPTLLVTSLPKGVGQ